MTVLKGLCMGCYFSNVSVSVDRNGKTICARCKQIHKHIGSG